MNIRILNGDFTHPADGWYDIEVPGKHPNKRAGIVHLIDSKAVDSAEMEVVADSSIRNSQFAIRNSS